MILMSQLNYASKPLHLLNHYGQIDVINNYETFKCSNHGAFSIRDELNADLAARESQFDV